MSKNEYNEEMLVCGRKIYSEMSEFDLNSVKSTYTDIRFQETGRWNTPYDQRHYPEDAISLKCAGFSDGKIVATIHTFPGFPISSWKGHTNEELLEFLSGEGKSQITTSIYLDGVLLEGERSSSLLMDLLKMDLLPWIYIRDITWQGEFTFTIKDGKVNEIRTLLL